MKAAIDTEWATDFLAARANNLEQKILLTKSMSRASEEGERVYQALLDEYEVCLLRFKHEQDIYPFVRLVDLCAARDEIIARVSGLSDEGIIGLSAVHDVIGALDKICFHVQFRHQPRRV